MSSSGPPDPDDQMGEAANLGSIVQPMQVEGALSDPTDVDLLAFTAVAGQRIRFDLDGTGGGLDSYLRLFDFNGRRLARNDDGPTPDEPASGESFIEYTFATGGTFYVGVSGHGNRRYNPATGGRDSRGSTGDYALVITPQPPDILLPDLVVWAQKSRKYLYGSWLDHHTLPGRTLLRLTTAIANTGAGPMELRGGEVNHEDGSQEVFQRVFDSQGGHADQLAGTFVHHEAHGHIHFESFARYTLREVTEGKGVGDVVAGGEKTSFCLRDSRPYRGGPSGGPEKSVYDDCGEVQGISPGWADVYPGQLPDQWVDVTGVPDGVYWLEVTADPDGRLLEADESNNVTRVRVVLKNAG